MPLLCPCYRMPLLCPCYASAMPLPCLCYAPAMPLPCLCHAFAMPLHAPAMPLLCPCPGCPRLRAWAKLEPLQSNREVAQPLRAQQQPPVCCHWPATRSPVPSPCRASPSRSAAPLRSHKQAAPVPLEASNANATIASLEALEDKAARSPSPDPDPVPSSGSMYAGAKILGRIARLACT